MAVVVYKCDTCKREIELVQNPIGMEVMSHCIITNGCKGHLHQTAIKPSYVRGKLPDPDPTGLRDWIPRQVYFKTTQDVPLSTWKIKHELGTNPFLRVHIYLDDGSLIETSDYNYTIVSPYQIDIAFSDTRRGIVQCFAQSSISESRRENNVSELVISSDFINITGSGVISFAVPSTVNLNMMKIGFVSAISNDIVYHEPVDFTSQTSSLSPWWKQLSGTLINKVFFSGRPWDVRTARFDYLISSTPAIVLGSTFFFTTNTEFPIVGNNTLLKTFTVDGNLDNTLLTSNTIAVVDSFGNNGTYTIVDSIFNIAVKQTTIRVLEEIPQPIVSGTPHGKVVVDYPIPAQDGHILLANDPYDSTEKITNSTINLSSLSYANAKYTKSDSTDMHVDTTLVKSVFPHIVV